MQSDVEDLVLSVLTRITGLRRDQITLDARLVQDLQLDGDDAIDALLEISKECSMDMSGFDSSLYFRPEPSLLSVLRFLPWQKQKWASPKLTLTVGQLIEAARRGRLQSP
jgi:hypothetical protein